MHPVNFPGAVEIKKPSNMTDEECMSVWATYGFDTLYRMMRLAPMLPENLASGIDEQKYPYYLTAWIPNKEDRDAINSGRPIFIKTIAHQLPPMAVFTLNENELPNYASEEDNKEAYYQRGYADGYNAAIKKQNEPAKVSDHSDALASQPNFEQLVSLIEKNFRDVLELCKIAPERINQAWERYKCLNHLYQSAPGSTPNEEPWKQKGGDHE